MLDKAGLTYKALRCGCHAPMFTELGLAAPEGFVADERHNNCSGKHAGFLAYCVQHGHTLDDYIDPSHPLQQAIRRDVARATGTYENNLKMGIDGCSAPTTPCPWPIWRAAMRAWPAARTMRSLARALRCWARP